MSNERRFTAADVDAFTRASHDFNPLHNDAAYAQRTPFGGRVVHGMLGVLAALQSALETLPLNLRRIEIRFHRPLRLDVPHRVSLSGDGAQQMTLNLHRGGAPYATIEIHHSVASGPFARAPAHAGEAPTREAPEWTNAQLVGRACRGVWTPDPTALTTLAERLSLRIDHLPPLQLSALLWVSYLVGMELPGRQALFRSVRIDFASVPLPPTHSLEYTAEASTVDLESGRMEATAKLSSAGVAFASVVTSAYNRPAPSLLDLDAFVRDMGSSNQLRDRVALVTGASGALGSLLAAGLAAQGADIVVHGRSRPRAERVANLVRSLGPRAIVVDGDLDETGVWERIARDTRRQLGRLDVAIQNASAPPIAIGIDEATPEEVEQLVMAPIRSMIRGHRTLLPLMNRQRGWVVGISSSATREPPASWWPYVTAKAAGEALLCALAVDYPQCCFLNVRPPRLQTDMTALHHVDLGLPPERVAKAIITTLSANPPAKNHLVLDQF